MTHGLWRHYHAFTIMFIQIIKLSLTGYAMYMKGDPDCKLLKEKHKAILTAAVSSCIFSSLQENLISNIASVICASYQGINQTDTRETFLNVHYFNY